MLLHRANGQTHFNGSAVERHDYASSGRFAWACRRYMRFASDSVSSSISFFLLSPLLMKADEISAFPRQVSLHSGSRVICQRSDIMDSIPDTRILQFRHIQNHDDPNTTLKHYWGYPDRVLPCRKDVGTCEYLDSVYTMHETSMLYTFILWGVLLAISMLWLVIRGWRQGEKMDTLLDRACDWVARVRRKRLLKDVDGVWRKWIFGRVSRAQHFNFLHRWLGYIIFVQAALHTLGWTIVEAKLYQPQPTTYVTFICQQYALFGCVALLFLTLMIVLSTKTAIRWTGYEVFKIGHWFLAVLYIGACWGHWDKLWCWMFAALTLMILDQSIRGLRMVYLHVNQRQADEAKVQVISFSANRDETVLRLDFDHFHRSAWRPGQHFHLCFPSLSIWQSHPFTPASLPSPRPNKMQHHTYILRVRQGQTAKLAALGSGASVPVILTGPYGIELPTWNAQNILAVSGGTGVTFTLPIVREALRVQTTTKWAVEFVWVIRRAQDLLWLSKDVEKLQELTGMYANFTVRIFVTREHGNESMASTRPSSPTNSCSSTEGEMNHSAEKQTLQTRARAGGMLDSLVAGTGHGLFHVTFLGNRHPSISEVVQDFAERMAAVGGDCEVVGSGPSSMGSDLRAAVSDLEMCQEMNLHWDARE
nr:ferric/cupric reductase transmembrane component 1 [Quercus suber]